MINKKKFENTEIQHLAYLLLIKLFVNTYNDTPFPSCDKRVKD